MDRRVNRRVRCQVVLNSIARMNEMRMVLMVIIEQKLSRPNERKNSFTGTNMCFFPPKHFQDP